MKIIKCLFAVTLVVLFANVGQAQELGLRFGNALGNSSSVAVDGVFALGKFSRLHADVSFGNGIALEVLWDFISKPIPDSPVSWYVGVGPSLYLSNPFGLGAAGEIGLEYHFDDIPLAIGLDFRPTFILVEKSGFSSGFGLNIRYVFRQ